MCEMTQLMWSAVALLGFVNLEKREEILNLITEESVDFGCNRQLPQSISGLFLQ